MSTDLQTALFTALAVGMLTILANVIRQAMWNSNDFRLARNESRLNFLSLQISELYSPLLGYLHESATYCDTLARVVDQLRSESAEDEYTELRIEAIHERFDTEHFEPLRNRITELLLSKRHLIVEDTFPPYLQELISHATELEATRTVNREMGRTIAAPDMCTGEWPRRVTGEIERILLNLRTEYRRHLRTAGKLR